MSLQKAVFLLLLLLPLCGQSQSSQRLYEKAQGYYNNQSYALAIEAYETALKKGRSYDSDELNYSLLNLANAYYYVKDYEKAESYYREVFAKNIVLKGDDLKAYLRYAQVLASNGKHSEAKLVYEKYTALQEQDASGAEFIKLYSNLDALTRNAASYRIDYLGINSGSADFSPMWYQDGLVFVSGREKNSPIKRVFTWDNSAFLDLFYIEHLSALGNGNASGSSVGSGDVAFGDSRNTNKPAVGDDFYSASTANDSRTIANQGSEYIQGSTNYVENPTIPAKRFSRTLNTKYHEGPCTFYHREEKIIFTRNSMAPGGLLNLNTKNKINRLRLYSATKRAGDWRDITEFPFNSDDYSCGHPSLSPDDKTLYFVSDMPGGFGGTDIYRSRLVNGQWSKPENLGGSINTQGNEMFPFVDEDGNLYFSTDGRPGLGGLDLFFSSLNASGLPTGKVRNLGAPLNSNSDDFGIVTDGQRKGGYFSSNRKRGGSDDDIYHFERLGTLYGCRELVVHLFDKATGKPLPKTAFTYTNKQAGNHTEGAITNSQGTIKLCLDADSDFNFAADVTGYEPTTEQFSNIDASDYEPSVLNIYLTPMQVEEKKVAKREQPLVMRRREQSFSQTFKGIIVSGESDEPLAGVHLTFTNRCTGLSQEFTTKKDGAYEFMRDTGCDYDLVANRDGYATSREVIPKVEEKKKNLLRPKAKVATRKKNVPNYTGGSLFDTKLYRVGDVVQLDNIYYDANSWKLNSAAEEELDRLAATLQRYPNMVVEIRSHTDTRGNAETNLELSKKRVDEVVKYLEKQKVDGRRIRGIGMGESQPVNRCGDGVQCTEIEHQQNRRTEFKILQIERLY